ncbi:hypothetical protein NUACC21_76040 [Scytonema sp. NUACC21]
MIGNMNRLLQFVNVCFLASSLLTGSIVYLSKPVFAGEPLFDKNCRHYPRTTENFKGPSAREATYIFRTLSFTANREKFFLTVLRARDGRAVFCISPANSLQKKRLSNVERIQSKYIYQIVKEQNKSAGFLITLREDSHRSWRKPYPAERKTRTAVYKLNLENPDFPVLAQTNSK